MSKVPSGSYFFNEPNFSLIKFTFLYDFLILKKVPKKIGSFNPWQSHTCWSSPRPQPTPAKHVSCFPQLIPISGHSVQLPTVWKSVFFKINPKSSESYLDNQTFHRKKIKKCLRNASLPFFIFYGKSCVELQNMWIVFFLNWGVISLQCNVGKKK